MKLSTRLLLFGAAVPSCLLLWGFGAAGLLFDSMLLESLDRALLAQAAVESVSIFEGPSSQPRLRIDRSPLGENVTDTSAASALYGPDGRLVVLYPPTANVPPRIDLGAVSKQPQLRTLVLRAGPGERELILGVRSPTGEVYGLRLTASLEHLSATMQLFYKTAGIAAFLVTALLLWLQIWHARGLARRLHGLAEHMDRLRRGELDVVPPADDQDDVISELRASIAHATERLRASRDAAQRFLADAAHELRTPLAAMNTDIDVTLRREREPAELRETLVRVREEVAHLTRLARDLLDGAATRNTNWDCPPGDAAQAVALALKAHEALAQERGVTLVQRGPQRLAARFQPEALRQVVDNLVTNALRYAPSGTQVRVELEEWTGGWVLAVEDAGPGVPEADREDVFEPFHRKDRSSSGTGLGLTIVRDAARRHGGRARIETAALGGARVVVDFPREPPIAG